MKMWRRKWRNSSCKHFICGFLPERFPRFLIRIPQIYYNLPCVQQIPHNDFLSRMSSLHNHSAIVLVFFFSFRSKRYNQASVMVVPNIMPVFDVVFAATAAAVIFVYEWIENLAVRLICVCLFSFLLRKQPHISTFTPNEIIQTHIHRNARINTFFFFT